MTPVLKLFGMTPLVESETALLPLLQTKTNKEYALTAWNG